MFVVKFVFLLVEGNLKMYCHRNAFLTLTPELSTHICSNFLQEFILEKVHNLGGPLLKDSAMLDSVTQSKDIISMAEERCQEAEVSHFSQRPFSSQ